MAKLKDITNHIFGRLKVLNFSKKKNSVYLWECLCECGNITVVSAGALKTGNTKSCGCLRKEETTKRKTLHGNTSKGKIPPIYSVWNAMLRRCTNTKDVNYKHYGGRGITVCEEWKEYINFYNWAINNNYSEKLTLDRINNNESYCPNNCRWVTMKVQANNKRNNRILVVNGISMNLNQWAKQLSISSTALRNRINRGWSIEDTVTIPSKKLLIKQL